MTLALGTAIMQIMMAVKFNQQNIEWEGTMNEWYWQSSWQFWFYNIPLGLL
jgi:hypothetical protein